MWSYGTEAIAFNEKPLAKPASRGVLFVMGFSENHAFRLKSFSK